MFFFLLLFLCLQLIKRCLRKNYWGVWSLSKVSGKKDVCPCVPSHHHIIEKLFVNIIFKTISLCCIYTHTQFPWLFFSLFLIYLFFYRRIIALQNFVVFCQTWTWISHRNVYIPSVLKPPPISLPIPPLQVDTEPLFDFPEPYSKFPLEFYTWWCKFPCYSFHTSHPLFLSPHVHKSILCVCFSIVSPILLIEE